MKFSVASHITDLSHMLGRRAQQRRDCPHKATSSRMPYNDKHNDHIHIALDGSKLEK